MYSDREFLFIPAGVDHDNLVRRVAPGHALEAVEGEDVARIQVRQVGDHVVIAEQLQGQLARAEIHVQHAVDVIQHNGDEILDAGLRTPQHRQPEVLAVELVCHGSEADFVEVRWVVPHTPLSVGETLVDDVCGVDVVGTDRSLAWIPCSTATPPSQDALDAPPRGFEVRVHRRPQEAPEHRGQQPSVRRYGGAVQLHQVVVLRLGRLTHHDVNMAVDTTLALVTAEQVGIIHQDSAAGGDAARPGAALSDDQLSHGIHGTVAKRRVYAHVVFVTDCDLFVLAAHQLFLVRRRACSRTARTISSSIDSSSLASTPFCRKSAQSKP